MTHIERHYGDYNIAKWIKEKGFIQEIKLGKVRDWLLKEHGIWVESNYMDDVLNFSFKITTIKDNTEVAEEYGYDTPNKAYLAAFNYIKNHNLI